MSRKHFIALARALKDARADLDPSGDEYANAILDRLTKDIANVCAGCNANFDRNRFYHASDYQGS